MPNWLDLIILLILGIAAAKGYKRGFIIEVCSFLAVLVGVYAAVHFSDAVAAWSGLDPERRITAFLITFLLVLLLVHLLARALTKLIDLAMLGWANKIAGIGTGLLRSAFILSVILNLFLAYSGGGIPPAEARAGSVLMEPIRSFSTFLLPKLKDPKWVDDMLKDLRREAELWREDPGEH